MIHGPREPTLPLRDTARSLAPSSPVSQRARETLLGLYHRVAGEPGVVARYGQWRSHLSRYYRQPIGDPGMFVRHTCVSTIARLIGVRILSPSSPPAGPEELAKVMDGTYFRERDVYNFAEEDFFTWTLHPPIAEQAMAVVGELMEGLDGWDPLSSASDTMTAIRDLLAEGTGTASQGDHGVPTDLAEEILSRELGFGEGPDTRVLDPACGPGTLVYAAARLLSEAKLGRGLDEYDTLIQLGSQVAGVDGHPAAVSLACAAYLLALGELVRRPHPPVLVPVYLADAFDPPRSRGDGVTSVAETDAVYLVDAGQDEPFALPGSVAADPVQLDWLFHRLEQYVQGARLRAGVDGQELGIEAVMGPLYAYATSPKRSGLRPLPPLAPQAAQVFCDTARRLIAMALGGGDTLWLHTLKNAAAPVHLVRDKFDLVVGRNGPGHQLAHFLAWAADLYLRDGGTVAVAIPASEEIAGLQVQGTAPGLRVTRVADLAGGDRGSDSPWRLVVALKDG